MQIGRIRASDHCQKRRTKTFKLFGPNPGNARHFIQALGAAFGHLYQGTVGKDDVGRDALRLGQGAAAGLEC